MALSAVFVILGMLAAWFIAMVTGAVLSSLARTGRTPLRGRRCRYCNARLDLMAVQCGLVCRSCGREQPREGELVRPGRD